MWVSNINSNKTASIGNVIDGVAIKPVVLSTVLALTMTLAGCGSESVSPVEELVDDKSTTVAAADTGNLIVAMTDAEEDFVSYTIGVNSILLTRENGDQDEVLGEQTQVDFVEYQELTELFSIVKAPVGIYSAITMELDYNDAYIVIQDELGNSYEAQAVDEGEVPLTTYTVDFQLAESEQLEIRGNQLSQLTLDLDLSSSNTILSFEPALVQVEPFVIGTASIDDEREHRVRGTLTSVDAETNTVTLNLRPMNKKQGDFGEFDLTLTDESSIEVDGEVLTVEAAISNLSEQGSDFPVIAYGQVEVDEANDSKSLNVEQLLAGSSVPWFGKDVFKGMISDLSEGVTYISGLAIDTDAVTREHISDQVLLTSETTEFVTRTSDVLNASYLVPGQKVQALGHWSGSEAEQVEFDASDDTIRILLSRVMGQVVSVDEDNVVSLEVSRFNKRPGKVVKRRHQNRPQTEADESEAQDDTASHVLVDISALSQLEISAGDWINATGYVSPNSIFDGEVDMEAKAVTKFEVSDTEVNYTAVWGKEGTTPEITDTNLLVDLETGRHAMRYRFNPENVMPELTSLTLVAAQDSTQFAIRQKGEDTEFYDVYADFLSALSTKLADEDTVFGLTAKGIVSQETETFELVSMAVKLN
mgnify:CR=1 FL=1